MATATAEYKLLVTITTEEIEQITNPTFTLNANGQSTELIFDQTTEHYYPANNRFYLTDGVRVDSVEFVFDEV